MARTSKSTKSRTNATASQAAPRHWWQRTGPLATATFLLTFLGLSVAFLRVVPDLTEQPEYQFSMAETRITPPNEWVPPTILSEVLEAAHLPESVSLLQPDLCRDVALAWEAHPWVKRVRSVRMTSDPGLQVDLEYRMPAAFVRVENGFYPVDADGVLLPPKDFSMADTARLPHVSNIRTAPQSTAGKPWGDIAVTSAARLATVLAPEQDMERYWKRFGFKSIVAPTLQTPPTGPDSLTFEIETLGGNRIVWGRPPGADSLEPTPETKLARLQEYQSRFGSLDGVNGQHRIDIRLFDGITLEPLGELQFR